MEATEHDEEDTERTRFALGRGRFLISLAGLFAAPLVPRIPVPLPERISFPAVTPESFQEAVIRFAKEIDARGNMMWRTPRLLVVSPNLAAVAEEILGSRYYPFKNEEKKLLNISTSPFEDIGVQIEGRYAYLPDGEWSLL